MKKTLLWTIPPLVPLVLLAAVLVLLIRWIGSDDCRVLLQSKTADALNAEAQLAPLNWNWFRVASPRFSAIGRAESALKQMEATGLQAVLKPSSIFSGVWGVKEITADELKLRIGAAVPAPTTPTATSANNPALPTLPATGLSKWIPSLVVIEVINGKKTALLVEMSQATISLTDSVMEARPSPNGEKTLFKLTGGTVGTSRYPDLKLTLGTARCILTDKGLDITGADFTSDQGGAIRGEAMFPSDGSPSTLSANWEKLPITVFLPRFADKLTGLLTGEIAMRWESDNRRQGSGTIRGEGITLTGIPALQQFAQLTGLEQFRRLPIQTFSTRFTVRDALTEWRDIVIESPGFLKITGEVNTSLDGMLSGTIQLGITSRIVNMIPMARELLGLEERDGYIWAKEPVTLGGTLSNPTESLTPKLSVLIAAGAEGVVREGVRSGLELLGIKVGDPSTPGATNAPTTNPPISPLPSVPLPSVPTTATNAVKTLQQGAGAALDALGGFLK